MKKEDWKKDWPKNSGWLAPDPGTCKSLKCGICDDEMNVKRNVLGPTSFVGALGGIKRLHDSFTCPNLEVDWHKKIVDLYREVRNTNSVTIKKIIREEIKNIRKTRKLL